MILRWTLAQLFGALFIGFHGAAAPGEFENLGIPVRAGGLMGCIVGPNGKGGEALYFNFNQLSGKLFLVQVEPDTGEANQFNAPDGPGAWAQIVGPDGSIYLGTWDGALVLKFDPQKPELGIQVKGKPSRTEDYIWQYAVAPDGWIYGCTYPQAKLVRFRNSKDGIELNDLGRMHPTEMYARSVAVGPTGRVYVGIGTTVGDLVVYDPRDGSHKSILPPKMRGANGWTTVGVSKRQDGNVYAEFGTNLMRLEEDRAVVVASAPAIPLLKLRDGRIIRSFERGRFVVEDPRTGLQQERRFKYAGAGDRIFVVGNGPNGCVYGSTAMPLEVFRFDPQLHLSEHLGAMPGGEVYSMLTEKSRLYLCYYGGSIMNLYDPERKYWRFGTDAEANPISFGGVGDGHLRPRAMVRGPDNRILIGSEPPYGQLGGAIAIWDPKQNRTVENYRHVVTNQSIVSLAWEPKTGLIFGGSGNYGGGGTQPVEKEAHFFAFDPVLKRTVFEEALVPGARNYPATFAADGKVFTTVKNEIFVVDAASRKVLQRGKLPGSQVDISLGRVGANLVGLTSDGIYSVGIDDGSVRTLAKAPKPVNCGFALQDRWVYFGSGTELWRYKLPSDLQGRAEH